MPWGLKRFHQSGQIHFITASCYRRQSKFSNAHACALFQSALERVRQQYQLCVYGYVVMPEHIHLLISEPDKCTVAAVMQSLKQGIARTLALRAYEPFWQERYYDFNVWSEHKFTEKLRYIHRNPVQRGLVARPEDWRWSSFRHYATGEESLVEIESMWTARRRERAGVFLRGSVATDGKAPPKQSLNGAPPRSEKGLGGPLGRATRLIRSAVVAN